MSTLLFLNGRAEVVPALLRARQMGLRTIVYGRRQNVPGAEHADEFRVLPSFHPSSAVAAALEHQRRVGRIDGVLRFPMDDPRTIAAVVEALELPGFGREHANLFVDKLAQRERLEKARVPLPVFTPISRAQDLAVLAAESKRALVVRPADSWGGRGLSLVSGSAQAEAAFALARQHSATGRVLVEEFLEGEQISVESLFIGKTAYHVTVVDKQICRLDAPHPHIVREGESWPSRAARNPGVQLLQTVEAALAALDIRSGLCRTELVITSRGPRVLGVSTGIADRLAYSCELADLAGIDLLQTAILIAVGATPRRDALVPSPKTGLAVRHFFPGAIGSVSAQRVEALRKLPWVRHIELARPESDQAMGGTELSRSLGRVLTSGESAQEATERGDQVVRSLQPSPRAL